MGGVGVEGASTSVLSGPEVEALILPLFAILDAAFFTLVMLWREEKNEGNGQWGASKIVQPHSKIQKESKEKWVGGEGGIGDQDPAKNQIEIKIKGR